MAYAFAKSLPRKSEGFIFFAPAACHAILFYYVLILTGGLGGFIRSFMQIFFMKRAV